MAGMLFEMPAAVNDNVKNGRPNLVTKSVQKHYENSKPLL